MTALTALVQPAALPASASARALPGKGVVVLPVEGTIRWGAAVVSLGTAGLALLLCFPFKAGTLLTVRLEKAGCNRTVLACVREAAEQGDGSWLVGCDLTPAWSAEDLGAWL